MNIQSDIYHIAGFARELIHSSFPHDPDKLDELIKAAGAVWETQLTAVHHKELCGCPLYLELPSHLEAQLLPDLRYGLPGPLVKWIRIVQAYRWADCLYRLDPVFRVGRQRISGGTRLTRLQRQV